MPSDVLAVAASAVVDFNSRTDVLPAADPAFMWDKLLGQALSHNYVDAPGDSHVICPDY